MAVILKYFCVHYIIKSQDFLCHRSDFSGRQWNNFHKHHNIQRKYTCEGAPATDWPVATTSGWTPCICEEETEKQMWWHLNKYENKSSTEAFIDNMNWYVRLDDFINSFWNLNQVELMSAKGEMFLDIIWDFSYKHFTNVYKCFCNGSCGTDLVCSTSQSTATAVMLAKLPL